jgi:hypothetical protein
MIGQIFCRATASLFVLSLLAGPAVYAGEVNCKFVLKNLALPGRTVESVAETMGITEADIEKCQKEAGAAAGSKAAEAAAGAVDAGADTAQEAVK